MQGGAMLDALLKWLVAMSAFGGFAIGIFILFRTRSKTDVTYRWELTDDYADIPFPLASSNFEASLRKGLVYLLPGIPDIYNQPVTLRLVIRVSRRGTSPVTLQYVELGSKEKRISFDRQPGQIGSALRTIDPNNHFEWFFDFKNVAAHLLGNYPEKNFPAVNIRVSTGDSQKNQYLKSPDVELAEVRALMSACEKVWPENHYPPKS